VAGSPLHTRLGGPRAGLPNGRRHPAAGRVRELGRRERGSPALAEAARGGPDRVSGRDRGERRFRATPLVLEAAQVTRHGRTAAAPGPAGGRMRPGRDAGDHRPGSRRGARSGSLRTSMAGDRTDDRRTAALAGGCGVFAGRKSGGLRFGPGRALAVRARRRATGAVRRRRPAAPHRHHLRRDPRSHLGGRNHRPPGACLRPAGARTDANRNPRNGLRSIQLSHHADRRPAWRPLDHRLAQFSAAASWWMGCSTRSRSSIPKASCCWSLEVAEPSPDSSGCLRT